MTIFQQWKDKGGSLGRSLRAKKKLPEIYPYLNSTKKEGLARGIIFPLLVVIGIFALRLDFFDFLRSESPISQAVDATMEASQATSTLEDRLWATGTAIALSIPTQTPFPTLRMRDEILLSPTPTPYIITATPDPLAGLPPFPSATPTATAGPSLTPFAPCLGCERQPLQVRLAWFWPELGGSHCPALGCSDYLSNDPALPWRALIGVAAACPDEIPLGAWVEVQGVGNWQCLERLPIVRCDLSVCTVAILSDRPLVDDWQRVYDAWAIGGAGQG